MVLNLSFGNRCLGFVLVLILALSCIIFDMISLMILVQHLVIVFMYISIKVVLFWSSVSSCLSLSKGSYPLLHLGLVLVLSWFIFWSQSGLSLGVSHGYGICLVNKSWG